MSAAEAADQTQTAPGLAYHLPDVCVALLECTLGNLLRRSARLHRDRRAHFKVPRRWLFVDAFPLTPNGKIAKVAVEELFCEFSGAAEKVEP